MKIASTRTTEGMEGGVGLDILCCTCCTIIQCSNCNVIGSPCCTRHISGCEFLKSIMAVNETCHTTRSPEFPFKLPSKSLSAVSPTNVFSLFQYISPLSPLVRSRWCLFLNMRIPEIQEAWCPLQAIGKQGALSTCKYRFPPHGRHTLQGQPEKNKK